MSARDRFMRANSRKGKTAMKPKPGKAMTAAEADVIAGGIKRKRDGGDQRREWEQSPFDRYETELLLFVERGLTVAECLAWVKQQERRLSLPATRLGFWFTKHGWPREKRQEAMRAASEKTAAAQNEQPEDGKETDNAEIQRPKPSGGTRRRGFFSRTKAGK